MPNWMYWVPLFLALAVVGGLMGGEAVIAAHFLWKFW